MPVVLSRASGQPNFNQEWSVTVSRAGDYCVNNWLRVTIPAVVLSENNRFGANGRIRWCRNLMHNLLRESTITFNDLVAARFDSYHLDFWRAFTVSAGKHTGYANMIGSIAELIQPHRPGCELPSVTLNLPLPYPHCADTGSALPCAALPYNEIRLTFSFRNWSELLIVDEITGPGTSIAHPVTLADLASGEPQIVNTQVWATYAIVSNDERKRMGAAPRDMLIEQVQTAPVQTFNPMTSSQPSYDIRFSHAIKVLFFAARNKTCPNEHSNYSAASPVVHSTADGDYIDFTPASAVDPIAFTSLCYENTNRLTQMGSDYFSLVNPWYHAPCIPLVSGLHCYSYALDFAAACSPTGSTNFGKLTNVSIIPTASKATLELGPPGSGSEVQQKFEFIVTAVSWNIIISAMIAHSIVMNSGPPSRMHVSPRWDNGVNTCVAVC